MDKNELIKMIGEAFQDVEYPGDWCLKGSNEGKEPFLVEEEFKGKDDWKTLDAKFLDLAPAGFASALSFFSDEAFHFYLPAYMICDLNGELERVNVSWRLTNGLDESSKNDFINKRRYGERTWYDHAVYKYSMFNEKEIRAIIAYLEYKNLEYKDEFDDELFDSENTEIKQALKNYWYKRIQD